MTLGRGLLSCRVVPSPAVRRIRHLDKLVDELAQGKAIDKVVRA